MMRKREIEHLPIRSIENSFNDQVMAKFEMDRLELGKDEQTYMVEAHRHDFYHILYVKDGCGEHSIDFKTYEIKPDSIFFTSPGQVHSLEIDNDVDGYVISFDSGFFMLNNSVQNLVDYPFFHSINNDPVLYLSESNAPLQDVLDEMFKEFNAEEKGRVNILRALMEILLIRSSRMYTRPSIDDTPMHMSVQLRKLDALIDQHFKKFKLLNDYADMMYISPKHLNSISKKGLNKTVTNLIHERTLIEAKRLLLFTDNTISEIAYELGFADKSYFMRFFKKHTEMTADAYRNTNKVM
ncbi:MAG: AraC family transcriptional regulator [Carboxylicivirga sp.]|jgi:AraC-like DNA-binding protein/mannose-6-phosphate isomerase-like protein (cupin superfamily)|nr:AraC family transcriptional regulator [Carboxylicivirga sp.]